MRKAAIARSRAPTVFLVRIKTIRTKNTVMVISNNASGLPLFQIADYGRIYVRP
jgi:hypothetical protein